MLHPGGRPVRQALQSRCSAWRLCFSFVAKQLLVSANILIMFNSVTSEAEVVLWLR